MIRLRYSGDLRDTMVWTEEVPDELLVPYISLAASMEYFLCPDHSLYLETGFRQVHPFRTPYMDDEELTGRFFGGLFYGFKL